ncbi:MAG: TlpA family protein disulfide reductase [Flavobacteriaceae bacterium]|nr:TlpA family protein disulfide reductase [Flavobacteriaceae bacterium]
MKTLILIAALVFSSFSFSQKTLKNVNLQTLEGKLITMKSMLTNEVTVLSLWSTKCAPCKKKLNAISKVYENWKNDTGVKFYAVSIDKTSEKNKIKSLAKSGNWNFEVLLDGDKNLRKALGVRMVPLTLVIKNNKIVYREAGYSKDSKQKLYKAIKKYSTARSYASL